MASFLDEVQAETKASGTQIPKIVVGLNGLPKKERAELVAALDSLPVGVQWTAVARALNKRFVAAGLDVRVNDDNVKNFVNGSRRGLEA